MEKTYVAFDLETTGLDPNRDMIIEIGAVRFRGAQELETFSTFVNPGRSIPGLVTELTGITNADVRGAIPAAQAVRQLSEFVGRDPVVGHNVQFDLDFVRRYGALQGNRAFDTFELAGILVPHAGRYSLANLYTLLELQVPGLTEQTHRALDDARMAHQLFIALLARIAHLPPEIQQEIARLGRQIHWGPTSLFRSVPNVGEKFSSSASSTPPAPSLHPADPPRLLDVNALTDLLRADGLLSQEFADYEARPQQVEMMQAIAYAFNHGEHLLVEAGTGTGKSLAYLLPAVFWAVQNGQRVVISTNTINLQEQLLRKDLPLLAKVLPQKFRTHLLKGKSHYLCQSALRAMRHRGPRSKTEMGVLAKVLCWLPYTEDGDGDELFLPSAEERAIWRSLSAADEACLYDENDFYAQARAKAETAHILVINHALLLADIANEGRVLPAYDMLIVDEAHHLERAATESLRQMLNWASLRYTLESLSSRRHGKPAGVFAQIQQVARGLPRKLRVLLDEAIIPLTDGAEYVLRRLEELFDSLELFAEENIPGARSRYAARLRLTKQQRELPGWRDVELAWARVASPLATVSEGLAQLASGLEDLTLSTAPELEEPRVQLVGTARRLATAESLLQSFIAKPDESLVYWIEKPRHHLPLVLNIAPADVSTLIRDSLFKKKRSVVLTSATLRIAESFDYIRARLGAEEAGELAVGSPFDYGSAALLYLVTDIPEPGQPHYQKLVDATLIELFTATKGRGMALYTSYSQLRASAAALTGKLAQVGITVYAQGSGGSRGQLLEHFRRSERAVLLGTRSFWEGVDIPGEDLSCLAIVKLPFDVPNEPLVAARSERYDDPFNEYMVPEAILRFMQGFGRLIRTASDQGIAVVLDKRLLTKRYGQRFLASLPSPKVRRGTRAELPNIAARWLAGKPLPTPPEPDPEAPWGVPPEDPPWFWGA